MSVRKRSFLIVGLVALLAYTGTVSASAAPDHNTNSPAVEAKPTSVSTLTGANSAKLPGNWDLQDIGPGVDSCPRDNFCIWHGLNYSGAGLAIGGVWDPCQALNWQKTDWHNHVFSVKNNATGGVSIWNRRTGGGSNYDWLYDLVPGAYSGDFPAGRQADLMQYDPTYTCPSPH